MSFEIIPINEIYVIEGEINASTINQFKKEIKTLFKLNNELVINLDRVTSISLSGIKAFVELNLFAFEVKRILVVEGKQLTDFYK